jgi:hypothetical protein
MMESLVMTGCSAAWGLTKLAAARTAATMSSSSTVPKASMRQKG